MSLTQNLGNLARKAKPYIPQPLWLAAHQIARNTLFYPSWHFQSMSKNIAKQLEPYKDKHKGERCFLIGNGPSLNNMDLTKLKNEKTIGQNRIYLNFDKMQSPTSYLVCINKLVIEQFGKELADQPCPKFINWSANKYIPNQEDVIFLRCQAPKEIGFRGDIRTELYSGSTVTFISMQIAYFMGFDEVILIGVDHNFADKGKAHNMVTSKGDDKNHFHPDYFGKNIKWQLPDLEGSERAYQMAKKAFEADGRKIIDATLGGKLNIFDKTDYNKLF